MKIYTVAGRYCRTQDDAKKRAKEVGVSFNPETDFDDVPVSPAADLVVYLNNLVVGLAAGPRAADPVVALASNNVTPISSVMVDEAFEGLPITHQLTLTALALENARAEIVRLQDAAKGAPRISREPEEDRVAKLREREEANAAAFAEASHGSEDDADEFI